MVASGEDDGLGTIGDQFLHIGGLDAGLMVGACLGPIPFARATGEEFSILETAPHPLNANAAPGKGGYSGRIHRLAIIVNAFGQIRRRAVLTGPLSPRYSPAMMRAFARAALAMLMLVSAACNLQRVLDPSLPTSTAANPLQEAATATATSIPLPTQEPLSRVEAGDQALFYGDWDRAIEEYQRAFDESSDANTHSAALLGIARTYLEREQYEVARDAANTLLDLYPNTVETAAAHFVRARALEALGDYSEAAASYTRYLELRPGALDSYVHEWIGNSLAAGGDYSASIEAYQLAIDHPRLGNYELVQSKIGTAYFSAGDYQSAIITYQDVYLNTANDYFKADMDLAMGRAYLELNQPEQAYPLFLDAVNNYPLAFSAYSSLVELVNAGVPVDDLQRGLVDYYGATVLEAGGDRSGAAELYAVAIAAFDRYLLANPEEHNSTPHHFRALSLRALDDIPGAIQEWEAIIADHEFDTYWDEAYNQKALTEWLYLENYEAGIDTLLSAVAGNPSQTRAAEFLFTAGRIAERGGRLTRSAEIWERISNEYPNSEYAFDGLFFAGISRTRLGEMEQAQSLFARALESSLNLGDEARALFWLGKSREANGDTAGAEESWSEAARTDPTGYYSERAEDLLAGIEPFTPPAYSLNYDIEAERAEAAEWIISTFGLPENTDLGSLGALASDPRSIRGHELWELGEYEMARAEFESLRQDVAADPADSFRLANAMLDLGLYRTAIFAAREVLNLAGMSDAETMNAPTYFNRIRFGAYYADIVLDQAEEDDLDPLFILSVMRQESLFEGFVTSSAGARGLMQIVPSTGDEIAALRGWPPDFEADDLYRPVVSIRLGTDYLATQLNSFDGNPYAALAAYNGGPGNASYWSSIDNDDMDLFLEVIHFAETRNYIRSVYELFGIYGDLYAVEK